MNCLELLLIVEISNQGKRLLLGICYYGSKSMLNAKDRKSLPSQGFGARRRGKACEHAIIIWSGRCYDGGGEQEEAVVSRHNPFSPLGSQG